MSFVLSNSISRTYVMRKHFAKLHNKLTRYTNLEVLVHPLPQYCRVLRMRIVLPDDSDYLLPMRPVLNQYLVDSTKIDQIGVTIV